LLASVFYTSRKYIRKFTGDVGFTASAEKRLTSFTATLTKQKNEVSLEIDKMAIDPKIKKTMR
jgi:hypothetical protein